MNPNVEEEGRQTTTQRLNIKKNGDDDEEESYRQRWAKREIVRPSFNLFIYAIETGYGGNYATG